MERQKIFFIAKMSIAVWLVLFSSAVWAQVEDATPVEDIDAILRKQDLLAVVAQSEKAAKTDLPSLFFRLELYSRAANGSKMATVLDQIIAAAGSTERPIQILARATPYAKDPLVRDTRVLFRFLRSEFDSDVFGRLTTICSAEPARCDVNEIDSWLGRKATDQPETDSDVFTNNNGRWAWIERQIQWRRQFGGDISVITAQFSDAVRNDPTNLNAALRFVRFAQSAQDLKWLAESFSSNRAYDYFELGGRLARLSGGQCCPQLDSRDDRDLINLEGAKLLRKSLDLPFTENDIRLMWTYALSKTSIPPKIGNHQKQLRYWTKKELASAYVKIGMAQEAQPLVEELASFDTSDIIADGVSRLAGASQMASGARVVESKILTDQAARQDTYRYWTERIEYYRGRKEPVQVFDSYLQALKLVPVNLSERNSGEQRLSFIRNFADFASDSHFRMGTVEMSNLDEMRDRFQKEAEAFLAEEFERTKRDSRYAYELLAIIHEEDFDDLSDRLLHAYPAIILGVAGTELIQTREEVALLFFRSELIDPSTKNALFTMLLQVAAKMRAYDAAPLCELLIGVDQPHLTPRLIPILLKNYRATKRLAGSDEYERRTSAEKYPGLIFDAYIRTNDWRSGEKFLSENPRVALWSSYERLALAAARSGSTENAMRFWKIRANLNRRALDYLSSYRQYQPFVEELRAFYRQMKIEEPYSPVPDLALRALN